MKRLAIILVSTSLSLSAAPLTYPETRTEDVTDTYHGVEVKDPYRWLEDDRSDETAAWVKSQNAVTQSYLDTIPKRKDIHSRLTELWNYERYGLPSKKGDRYFYSKNNGLQNQSVLYTTQDLSDPGKILLDPNTLSEDGTVALKSTSISNNGKFMAYGISRAGSDWVEWKVRDIGTGKDLSDHIEWSKFSGASWASDDSGFYYGRFDQPKKGDEFTATNEHKKIYFHKLGDPQNKDTLVYKRDDQPKWGLGAFVTDDGDYLMIYVTQGTSPKNGFFYKNLKTADSSFVELLKDFDASYNYVTNVGSIAYFMTDLDAPKGRLISIDLENPDRANWKEVIPESEDTLEDVNHTGGQFFVTYMKDAKSIVQRHDMDGKLMSQIALPGLGSAGGFGGKADSTETFYYYTSFNTPTTLYHYDIPSNKSTIFKKPKLAYDPEQFESKQIFVTSKDGTKVPSFIVHKKGLKLDGSNPTLLYGYGGFNVNLTPSFSTIRIQWMEMGGVFVLSNLRGGSEYGEEWHQAGMLHNKQNVFDDFISTAEWLIENKYTSREKLAISGGSNGGLLVGACMTQRPDLFGAALPAVGVLDMLRFHKFTIGWAWVAEYGSSEDKDIFPLLRKYSPYHNLKAGTEYPPTMVTTGDHDDRVVPAHSFKFAAALQAAHKKDSANPVLIRIETDAGHGAGTPTSKRIDYAADVHAFLYKTLEMKN